MMENTTASQLYANCAQGYDDCADAAIARVREICLARGARLTDVRLQVLRLVWRHRKPLGAYRLIDLLSQESTRPIAPPTVYRALEFLLEHGFIHRIKSLSAFVGCSFFADKRQSHFLVCRVCAEVVELHQPLIAKKIYSAAREAAFTVETQSLEVMGLCHKCHL